MAQFMITGFFPAMPLQEQHWLVQHWMWGAAIAAPLALMTAVRNGGSNISKHPARFIALSVGAFAAALSFEECGFDLTGKHFAVKDHYNAHLKPYTNHDYNDDLISLVAVVSTLQAMAAADYYLRTGNSLPAAACWAARTMHAFGSHLIWFFDDLKKTGDLKQSYNPGLFMSAIIIPVGLWFMNKIYSHHGPRSVIMAILSGPVTWAAFAYAPANLNQALPLAKMLNIGAELPKLFMWQYAILTVIGACVPFFVAERIHRTAPAVRGAKRGGSPRSASMKKSRAGSPRRSASPRRASFSQKAGSPARGKFRSTVKKLFGRKNSAQMS